MAAHNELGRWGEDLATEYLQQHGYRIIERDWKSGRRDIDIIATDGNQVVFVEVKTRRNRLYGDPEEAVKATVVLGKEWKDKAGDDLVKELQQHVKKETAPYKYPRIVEFVDELPKTISGKIRRVEIRKKDAEK